MGVVLFQVHDERERGTGQETDEASHGPVIGGAALSPVWMQIFADVLGKELRVGARVYTIVGVAPPGFNGMSLAPVSVFFPITSQLRVMTVVQRHIKLAIGYVDEHARAGVTFDGSPLCCHATTRKGTACQRVPLPGSKYCPSHQHLEEDFERAAEVVAA